jgi:hypothetical protein
MKGKSMTKLRQSLIVFTALIIIFTFSACRSDATQQPQGNVLFRDDFSNSKSGWDRVSEDNGSTGYVNGTYQIYVDDANSDFFANPYQNFADTRVEVDAVKLEGDDNNDFGIICRYQDAKNFYAGLITSDGFAAIIKMSDGNYRVLGHETMIANPAVKRGEAKNLIRFDCVGQELTLYVNDLPVEYQTDTQWVSGDVGLLAGSFDAPGVRIAFDNFTVYRP